MATVGGAFNASWPNLNDIGRPPDFSLSKSLMCCSLCSDCLAGDFSAVTIEGHSLDMSGERAADEDEEPSCAGVQSIFKDGLGRLSAELPIVYPCQSQSSPRRLLTKVTVEASRVLIKCKSEELLPRASVNRKVTNNYGQTCLSDADVSQIGYTARMSLDSAQNRLFQEHLHLSAVAPQSLEHAEDGCEQLQPNEPTVFDQSVATLERTVSMPAVDDPSVEAQSQFVSKRGKDYAHSKRSRQARAASMVVPAITPRLPLIGLLPKSVGKSSDKSDLVKSKEKSLKLRCSKKQMKSKEVKLHFWMSALDRCSSSSSSSPSRCDVCGKGHGDFFQCNDCSMIIHPTCKSSVEKQTCPSKAKHPSKHCSLVFPTRPLSLVTRFSSLRSESVSSGDGSQSRNGLTPTDELILLPDGVPVYTSPDEQWSKAGLWDDDGQAEAWSTGRGKDVRSQMSSRDVKRQHIIRELYMTERHHCTTLVVLKHTYYDGLLDLEILSEDELSALMPNLNLMLEIHMAFLQSMKQCIDRSLIVNDVHDVFLEMFTGERSAKMRKVYTYFCAQKENSVVEYRKLCQSNARFQSFVDNLNRSPFFKCRSLPDCLLLITQRLSKYHSFVESLRKNTCDPATKESMVQAEQAVKKLIADVDAAIGLIQLQKLRQRIFKEIDSKDSGTLFLGKPFTADHLVSSDRELLHAGEVRWQNARRKPIDVLMLLYTDVIVFLQRTSHGQYSFCTQDNKDGVVSLHKLIVREKAGRMGSQGLYLISAAPHCAEMYEIVFHTKNQLASWTERIQRAVDSCPLFTIQETSTKESGLAELDQSYDQFKMLIAKASESSLHLKDALEEQLTNYASIIEALNDMNLNSEEEEEKAKILRVIDECLPIRMTDYGIAKFVDLSARVVREHCKQQLTMLGNQCAPISPPETSISRSQTFHGLRSGRRSSKLYRKHVTVSGIPNALEKCPSSEGFEQHFPDCRASAKGHLFSLLAKVKDSEFHVEQLKREKAALLVEREREKNARGSVGQLAFSNGLEELRRLHADLERRRAEFQASTEEKTAQLDAREKKLNDQAIQMEVDSAELHNQLERVKDAWQKLRAVSRQDIVNLVDADRAAYDNSAFDRNWSSTSQDGQASIGSIKPEVPPYLLGSFVHGGLVPEGLVRQQLPSKLIKDDFTNSSLSSKIQCSMRERKKLTNKAKEPSCLVSKKK